MLTNDHSYGRLSLGGWCRDYCHWWTLIAWEQIHQKLWNLKAVKLLRSRSYATWKLYFLKANQWILVCGLWSWWFRTSQDIGGWGAICSLYGIQALYAFQVQWKLCIGLQLCLHDVAFWPCHNCRFMYVCACSYELYVVCACKRMCSQEWCCMCVYVLAQVAIVQCIHISLVQDIECKSVSVCSIEYAHVHGR
jgi:hypothetical protein